MHVSDYIVGLILIALVVRQLRGRPLTRRSVLLPIAIVTWAAADYLHTVPTEGNDLWLVTAGVGIGAGLGIATAWMTQLSSTAEGTVLATATLVAATLWIGGIGTRFAFGLYAQHGGGDAIVAFDTTHHLSGFAAWTAALILMSITEVLARSLILIVRARELTSGKRALSEVAL